MMNVLLTGSNGYIGNEFKTTFQYKYNISTFSSLTDKLDDLILKDTDAIVHLAALVHQKKKLSYKDYRKVNVDYPLLLAKKAKESGVKHFVFMSSIAVYGDDKVLLNEHTPCNPQTFYGQSKLEAEKKLIELENEDFCISIIRPPMVYGKNAPGNIASLIKLVGLSKLLPFGNIQNKRTFVYIENLLDFITRIIDLRKSGIFLVADDLSVSTTDLCKMIAMHQGNNLKMVQLPFFETFLRLVAPKLHKRLFENLEVDNSFSKIRLQHQNKYSVNEGIYKMIKGDS